MYHAHLNSSQVVKLLVLYQGYNIVGGLWVLGLNCKKIVIVSIGF